jgi:aspartyl-tRNA(Asn)/glutamyl-tRNA(Gln) amidotransferase subunit A
MSGFASLSLLSLRDKLLSREISALEAASACLERIEATEPRVDALLSIHAESALQRAKALDEAGPDPSLPLWGVPMAIKDAICVAGEATTCASKILENFVPFYDATCVTRLKNAGAVILGKANMDEFAMGSSNENSAFKTVKNPWDLSKVPGGSSGGSGASVAAGQCFAALGTDTGGSIRLPAAFCGVTGLKPTYGRVSRFGLIAYASSLDQIGPLARAPADCAVVLSAMAGHDPKDSTSSPRSAPDFTAQTLNRKDLKGLRLGMPEEYWGDGLTDEVRQACEAAVDAARALGAEIVPVALPHTRYAVAAYYIIATAEASSNLARFDGVRYGYRDPDAKSLSDLYEMSRSKGFGEEVRRRIVLGSFVLSAGYYDAYYRKAAQVRRLIRQDFLDAYERCDAIIGPASPFTAFGLGEKTDDPLQMYLADIFTISLNLAGLPGLSVPVGLGKDTGMPVGLQIFGKAWDEGTILGAAHALSGAVGELGEPAGLR